MAIKSSTKLNLIMCNSAEYRRRFREPDSEFKVFVEYFFLNCEYNKKHLDESVGSGGLPPGQLEAGGLHTQHLHVPEARLNILQGQGE